GAGGEVGDVSDYLCTRAKGSKTLGGRDRSHRLQIADRYRALLYGKKIRSGCQVDGSRRCSGEPGSFRLAEVWGIGCQEQWSCLAAFCIGRRGTRLASE